MAEQRARLGQRIAAARIAKNWKQKQLAAAVHVEPMTVSRWERGQHAPDIDTLEAIALATDQPLSFFVDRPDATGEADQVALLRGELGELHAMVAELLQRSA